MSATFPARYRGRCAACDEWFPEDTPVRFDEDQIVHADCGSRRDPFQPERTPCPKCFMVPAANGVCECDQ